jgi:cell division protein FtsB
MTRFELSRSWLFPVVCLIITGYFLFHTIQGTHGYRRMKQLKIEIEQAHQIAKETSFQRNLLSAKVRALSPESLDLDQLEESAMWVLNMGSEQDLIILD